MFQDYIKVLVYEERIMSREGMIQWNKKLRSKIRKIVFVPLPPTRYLSKSINTKTKLGEWMSDNFGEGTFILRGWTKGYTKTRVKFIRLARIKINKIHSQDIEDKHSYSFTSVAGISRHKFWQRES